MFNIVGIDPGAHLGTSVLSVDSETLDIINIHAMTVDLNQHNYTDTGNQHLNRLLVLRDSLARLLKTYNPIAIAIEEVFVNHKWPASSLLLAQYLGVIQLEARCYSPVVKIFTYAPMEIKAIIDTGKANKDDMRAMVSKLKPITQCIDIRHLDEHEIDAISIAYTAYLDIQRFPHLLV